MKIAIYCVTYHTYQELDAYLSNIEERLQGCTQIELSVNVCDNTEGEILLINYQPKRFTINVFGVHRNLGYFGGIHYMMEKVNPEDFDISIISNVDVAISDDFFLRLQKLPIRQEIGWIAPCIFSHREQIDKNPKIIVRYNKRKLLLLRMLFRFPLFYNSYYRYLHKGRKKVQNTQWQKKEVRKIYAGHGSFIILTKEYFKRCGIIDYPCFLFCEEIYLGEQCKEQQLDVVYEPSLRIDDEEHASTGSFKGKKYCQFNYQALSYIIKKYY